MELGVDMVAMPKHGWHQKVCKTQRPLNCGLVAQELVIGDKLSAEISTNGVGIGSTPFCALVVTNREQRVVGLHGCAG